MVKSLAEMMRMLEDSDNAPTADLSFGAQPGQTDQHTNAYSLHLPHDNPSSSLIDTSFGAGGRDVTRRDETREWKIQLMDIPRLLSVTRSTPAAHQTDLQLESSLRLSS